LTNHEPGAAALDGLDVCRKHISAVGVHPRRSLLLIPNWNVSARLRVPVGSDFFPDKEGRHAANGVNPATSGRIAMNPPHTNLTPARDGPSGDDMDLSTLIFGKDWSTTSIGPPEQWSPTLKMMIYLLLANRFPLLLWWGPEYVSIYNDAYRPILGTKHPKAVGEPFREVWPEIEHVLSPLIDAPFNGGPATWMDDILLEINRYGFTEESHFTIAYSPVPDETAPRGIGGVLATVHETTEKIVGERRIVALRDLGARIGEGRTADEACALAALALGGHDKDIPFALIYLLDSSGDRARLAAATGVREGEPAAVSTIGLGSSRDDGSLAAR
jgi:hypothetical protein